jgi:hypothetical protein
VQPSGAKSWAYRYRFGGKTRKLTIGGAVTDKGIEVISIGAARDIADEARVSVARRIDPIEANRAKQKTAAAEAAAAAPRRNPLRKDRPKLSCRYHPRSNRLMDEISVHTT